MDSYINVGKIVSTFGIKGELKIISDFEYKDRIFIKDFTMYVGNEKIKEVILSHRVHKNYDLTLFKNYTNINEVLKYIGKSLYIKREDLKLLDDEYLMMDLIGYEVYDNNNLLGVIIDYDNNKINPLFKVKGDKTFYLPNNKVYINSIIKEEKKVITNRGSELII